MEQKTKIIKLNKFLKKVQQLRGFGDMDSYHLANELNGLVDLPEKETQKIFEDLSAPRSWASAKLKMIDKIETEIGDIHNY